MQIIENGPLGLRSAVLQLRSRDHPCIYTLFPMIHVGERDFYDEVVRQLHSCDHILVEGVKHSLTKVLSRSYARLAASPRLRLVRQHVMADSLKALRGRIRNIDVPEDLFAQWWGEQPFWSRVLMPSMARLTFWYVARFWNRKRLAAMLPLDLAPTRESIIHMSEDFELDRLRRRRDEYIVARLEEFHDQHRTVAATVGIVFGARHMRAIVRHLIDRHGYYVAEGNWLTIFGWELSAVAPKVPTS